MLEVTWFAIYGQIDVQVLHEFNFFFFQAVRLGFYKSMQKNSQHCRLCGVRYKC